MYRSQRTSCLSVNLLVYIDLYASIGLFSFGLYGYIAVTSYQYNLLSVNQWVSEVYGSLKLMGLSPSCSCHQLHCDNGASITTLFSLDHLPLDDIALA